SPLRNVPRIGRAPSGDMRSYGEFPQQSFFLASWHPFRFGAGLWIIALAWMGIACLLNAHHCGRTHCRYTGPFYLAMILPVLALTSGIVPRGLYGWPALAAIILLGSKLIWWATERTWGRFTEAMTPES